MKKALLSLSLLFCGVAATNAQSFLSDKPDTVTQAYTPGDMFIYNYLKSNTGAPITLSWRISTVDTTGGWHFVGFCDNDLCYNAPAVLSGSYTPTYGTEFEDFHAVLNGDDAEMNSSASVTVRVTDNETSFTRFLTFIAYKSPTGVTITKADKKISMWPNPATENLNISFSPEAGIRYAAVYNTIGKVVGQYRIQGNSAKLDVSNLPAGVYMLRLSNGQGQMVSTKRFTVK